MPVTRPEKANVVPADLGTKTIAEVNAVLDKIKGPPSKGGYIAPDTFSNLSGQQRAEISLHGREVANDRYTAPRQIAQNLIAISLVNRLLNWIGNQIVGAENAKWLSRVIIFCGLYYRWKSLRRLSKTPAPEGGPKVYPFIGALIDMASHKDVIHDFLLDVSRKTNFQTLEVPVPMSCFVTVMDARDREYILKTNPWNYLKNRDEDPACFERIFAEVLGRGIFSTDGSEWFNARKIASHMFSGTALRTQMEHVFNTHADRVLLLLKKTAADKNCIVDMQEVFQAAVFDAFCEIAFGAFPNAVDSAIEGAKPQFLISFDFVQQVSAMRVVSPPLTWNIERIVGMILGVGREGEFVRHIKIVNDYIYEIIDKRLIEQDISNRTDLLSLYIQHSRSQGQPFTREDYRDIIANFMIAGRDTTSCTLTYATRYLSENREVLKRLQEEGLFDLNKQSSDGHRVISWEESKTIPFADAVVNEVLRLAPPVANDLRICVHDDVLPSGLPVRVGTRVALLNLAIGRDPFLWTNPDTFNPERWMRYDSNGVPQPVRRVDEYVHPIFFAGRRLCLGKDMARFETILFMSKLFAELDFESHVPPNATMVAGPVGFINGGCPCKITTKKH